MRPKPLVERAWRHSDRSLLRSPRHAGGGGKNGRTCTGAPVANSMASPRKATAGELRCDPCSPRATSCRCVARSAQKHKNMGLQGWQLMERSLYESARWLVPSDAAHPRSGLGALDIKCVLAFSRRSLALPVCFPPLVLFTSEGLFASGTPNSPTVTNVHRIKNGSHSPPRK